MILKRSMCGFLAVLMLCMAFPLVASADATATVDSWNSSRGLGELVVYTPEYGEKTGTNHWGAEAIVGENNKVTMVGAGNSAIPANGFVVSGHDDEESEDGKLMKTWVTENIKVGMYVYFDKRTMTLTVSGKPKSMNLSPFYDQTKEFQGVNGNRGEDELVIYTPAKGTATGTNAYGYEVTVTDGIITKRGGNNSAIPANGFVLSGHGEMARWLRIMAIDGMAVTYDDQALTVTLSYSADSLKQAVTTAIKQTETAISDAKAKYVYADYEVAERIFNRLKTAYEEEVAAFDEGDVSETSFAQTAESTLAELADIRGKMCDSYTVQYRAVWVRPSQKTAAEVQSYVEKLYNAGVNTICVEGCFDNGVIMKTPEDSLFEKISGFSYDVLQAYITACHQYNMECHLWMPVTLVGFSEEGGYDRSVVAKRKDWLSLNNEGSPDNEDGFMMIDPANAEAREYLVDFYQYIVNNYEIDGLELDYVRYYVSGDTDFGYTQAAFEGFEEAYGHGVTPTFDTSAAYWEDWCQYRRDCVTALIRAVREMIDREAPDVVLAADVAVPKEHALNKVYQEYTLWLEEGLLDVLHPMAYGDGYGDDLTEAVQLGGAKCMVVPGLGVYMDELGAEDMARQAVEDNGYGAYGDCYFEAATYLTDKTGETLAKTVYRHEAIAPFINEDASLAACFKYMTNHIDKVIVPLGGMTDAEATAVKSAIDTTAATISGGRFGSGQLVMLREAIAAVQNAQAKEALYADLYRAEQIVCVDYKLDHDQIVSEENFSGGSGDFPWILIAIGGVMIVGFAVAIVLYLRRRDNEKE